MGIWVVWVNRCSGGVVTEGKRNLKHAALSAVSGTIISRPLPELAAGFVMGVVGRLVLVVVRLQSLLL